jgi:hypothetical protein
MYCFSIPVIGGMIDLGTTAPRGWAIENFAAIVTFANQTGMPCTSVVCSWLGANWTGVLSSSPFPTLFLGVGGNEAWICSMRRCWSFALIIVCYYLRPLSKSNDPVQTHLLLI